MFNLLYQLFYEPDSAFSFLRLFNFISSRAFFAAITSLWLVMTFGRTVIVALYRRGFRDTSRVYEMVSTTDKRGTPTMGGLILIGATTISALLWCNPVNLFVALMLLATVWFGAAGFLDDWLKVRRRDSDAGLSRGAKYLHQIAFGVFLAVVFLSVDQSVFGGRAGDLHLPFLKHPLLHLGWSYGLFVVFMTVFSANAVNFADGMDGLAIVPVIFVALVYAVFAYVIGNTRWADYFLFPYVNGTGEITVFLAALLGSSIGFLWFNSYPAEVFMGDTGSLYLGGVIGTVAVLVKQEVLLFLVGGVFVAEILSDVVQDWIGIKLLRRRILYRAPIHHTFQHMGMADPKVVVRFWIVAGVLALVGLASLKIR